MSQERYVQQLVARIHSIGQTHESLTVARATSQKESLLLELKKTASMLFGAASSGQDVKELVDKLEAELMMARTLDVVGDKDYKELQDLIITVKES
ncbi:hypothetical protein KC968_00355 [Candidatus Saccharibacteria bacterium]|nr:hypothetical protein [Candidatus Saccharibacteria bacterium]